MSDLSLLQIKVRMKQH